MTCQDALGFTVNAQIKTPKLLQIHVPELKAEARTAWGCFTYLFAKG